MWIFNTWKNGGKDIGPNPTDTHVNLLLSISPLPGITERRQKHTLGSTWSPMSSHGSDLPVRFTILLHNSSLALPLQMPQWSKARGPRGTLCCQGALGLHTQLHSHLWILFGTIAEIAQVIYNLLCYDLWELKDCVYRVYICIAQVEDETILEITKMACVMWNPL